MRKELRNAGFVSLTLGAIGCGEPAQPDAVRAQDLFSKDTVSTDSLNGEGWRKYLDAKELHRAWAPPSDSPWRPYYKPTLIAAVSVVQSAAMPVKNESIARESEAIRFSKGFTFTGAAVFVDLPGEQSVAWGAALRAVGIQPVVTFNNWPHQFGVLRLERPLGALIYYADAMAKSPAVAASPVPAFLLERSRLGQKGLNPSPRDFDNRFFHPSTDFPPPTVLKNAGINHIVYINPRGTAPGSEEDDLNEYFTELVRHGMQFTYVKAGAEPYEMAIVVPATRSTIFTKENLVQYATSPSYRPHYYHSYPHYYYWHTNYWNRSSGAWGGSSASSGGHSSGFSS